MELLQNLDEQISALVDSECVAQELEGVIFALSKPEYQQRWDIYHHIGDLLRDRAFDPDLFGLVRSLDAGVLVDEPHLCFDPAERIEGALTISRTKYWLTEMPLSDCSPILNLSALVLLGCLAALLPHLAGCKGGEVSASISEQAELVVNNR